MWRPNATLSKIDLGNGFGRWNTMPTRRRSSTTSVEDARRSRSANRISPSVRTPGIMSFMRLNERSSVLLPQPEGPMIAVTLVFGISSETLVSA